MDTVTAPIAAPPKPASCLLYTSEYDHTTREVVTAFQRHFRPERIDGIADPSTRGTLQELLATRGRPRTIAARARTAMLVVAP